MMSSVPCWLLPVRRSQFDRCPRERESGCVGTVICRRVTADMLAQWWEFGCQYRTTASFAVAERRSVRYNVARAMATGNELYMMGQRGQYPRGGGQGVRAQREHGPDEGVDAGYERKYIRRP